MLLNYKQKIKHTFLKKKLKYKNFNNTVKEYSMQVKAEIYALQ